jgi:hypothetical protein
MAAEPHERPDLLRLDYVVAPRWLRQRRRAVSRAARPESVAAEVAREVLSRTRPGLELTLDEIIREQGVQPFDWADYRSRDTGLTGEDWAELREALRSGREQ